MKRSSVLTALSLLAVALVAPALHADVKTTEKATLKLEGMLGKFLGGAAKDGIVSTVAVKGSRKSSMNDKTGEIIDLTEEKVYRIDVKKKEYKVVTFAQLRKEWEEAKAEAEKNARNCARRRARRRRPARSSSSARTSRRRASASPSPAMTRAKSC